MKLYTKTGDDGTTGLFGGKRVAKNHPRVAAYGEVDELNAAIGVVLACGADAAIASMLLEVQGDLFVLGAELATPKGNVAIPVIQASQVERLERWIDEASGEVPALRTFILPGGTAAAAQLHYARTVCRRAERGVVSLVGADAAEPICVMYLNRLGDLLFAWARLSNFRTGVTETPWIAPRP